MQELLFYLVLFTAVFTEECRFSRPRNENEETGTVDGNSCPFHPRPAELNEAELSSLANQLDLVSALIEGLVDEETRPGISANIAYKNKIIWEGNFGRVSKTNVTKPTGDTIFRIASISKVFPTIFLYKLWEDGDVELSDPITKYAPNFSVGNPVNFTGELTLHDLASQVNGLQSYFSFDLRNLQQIYAWNGTLEETLVRIREELNLVIKPRTTCYYSNMAYALLARVLARNFTQDGSFENWAKTNIVDVLKLNNTGFVITDDVKEKMATGYYSTGQVAPLNDVNWFRPTGNYYSTTRDLAALSMSLMGTSDQNILTRETLVQMLTPVQKCGYGYLSEYTGVPWEINEQQTYLVLRKDGAIDGYASTLAMIPELEFSFSLLMNGARPPPGSTPQKVIDIVIPTLVNILRRKNTPLVPAVNPSSYVGAYQIEAVQTWNVTVTDDNILMMTNLQDPGTQFATIGLSYISEGILRMYFQGGIFPCRLGQLLVDPQNGWLVTFSNFTNGRYNQLDLPQGNFFKFIR